MLGLGVGFYGLAGNEYPLGGPITPTDIASDDLLFWFDSLQGVTEDRGTVTVWQAAHYSESGDLFAIPTVAGQTSLIAGTPTGVNGIGTGGSNTFELKDAASSGSDVQLTLDTSDGGWTIMGIYTATDWNGAQQALFGDPDDSSNFFRHDAADSFTVKASNQARTLDLDSALTDDDFVSVMLVCSEGGEMVLYINNTAQADTESFSDATKDLVIEQFGRRATADTLTGKLKQLIVWKVALTSDQRTQVDTWSQDYIS
tara:strand:- start:61 stop:831 length:771 start_codon:yes stop_codon:yes gene_type:complete